MANTTLHTLPSPVVTTEYTVSQAAPQVGVSTLDITAAIMEKVINYPVWGRTQNLQCPLQKYTSIAQKRTFDSCYSSYICCFSGIRPGQNRQQQTAAAGFDGLLSAEDWNVASDSRRYVLSNLRGNRYSVTWEGSCNGRPVGLGCLAV